MSLFFGELLRRAHLNGREQVALAAPADVRHAPCRAGAASCRSACLRQPSPLSVPSSVGTSNLAAERERREVDRNLAEQVQPVAPEELVLLHVDDDKEVAGRAAGAAGFALALQAELLTGRDAGRDLDGDLPLARDAARAAARVARLGDCPAGAAALRARARDREEALLEAHLSLAAALRHRWSATMPGAAPEPLHVSQFSWRGIWIVVSVPRADFLEGDLEVVPKVGAALRAAAAAAAAEQIAEAEDVAETAEDVLESREDVVGSKPPPAPPSSRRRGRSDRTGSACRCRRASRRPRRLP